MPEEKIDNPAPPDSASEEESDLESLSGEELRARIEEQFRRQDVGDVVVQFMISLSNLAYMKMGLTEETREIKDEAQSRLAIDSFKALLDAAGGRLREQDRNSLAGALASMQLMFVKAFAPEGETGPEGGASPGAPADSADEAGPESGAAADQPQSPQS
ncbi:MAG: DUF1844 domain-containing protein [Thermoleophilia bacterium]